MKKLPAEAVSQRPRGDRRDQRRLVRQTLHLIHADNWPADEHRVSVLQSPQSNRIGVLREP